MCSGLDRCHATFENSISVRTGSEHGSHGAWARPEREPARGTLFVSIQGALHGGADRRTSIST